MEELQELVVQFQEAHVAEFDSFQILLGNVSNRLSYMQEAVATELQILESSLHTAQATLREDTSHVSPNVQGKPHANSLCLDRCKTEVSSIVGSLPNELRSRVTRLTRHAGTCLNFFRAKKHTSGTKVHGDDADASKADSTLIPEFLFEAHPPEPAIILEAIAKHFLHFNRLSLFNTLCREVDDIQLERSPHFVSTLENYPWIYPEVVTRNKDDTADNDEARQGVTAEEGQKAIDSLCKVDEPMPSKGMDSSDTVEEELPKNTVSSCCLVRPEIVDAYKQLHTILNQLRCGETVSAIEWLKSQTLKKQAKHLHLLFALHEVQFFKLLTTEVQQESTDVSLALLAYIRQNLSFFFPRLRSEVLRLLGSLALYSDVFNTCAQAGQLGKLSETTASCGERTIPDATILNLFALIGGRGQTSSSPFHRLARWVLEHPNDTSSLERQGGDPNQHSSDIHPCFLAVYHQVCSDFQRAFCNLGTSVTPDSKQAASTLGQIEEDRDHTTRPIRASKAATSRPFGATHQLSTVVKLSRESPLAVAIAGGMACLPQLYQLTAAFQHGGATEHMKSWKTSNKLPLDIDLGPCFHFHTQFTCPICRSPGGDTEGPAATRFKPCKLPCGHMICRHCLDRITARTRRNMVKCPTCPHQALASSVQELVFDWTDHYQHAKSFSLVRRI